MDDQGLALLSGHPTLEELDLSTTKITDAGAASLLAIPSLRYLDVSYTALSAKGLGKLVELPNLKELTVLETNTTDDEILELSKKMPSVKIIGGNRPPARPHR